MTVILFVILFVMCVFYAVLSYLHSKKMPYVEAGSTSNIAEDCFVSDRKPITFCDKMIVNGKKLNASDYIPLVVKGSCMQKRNINPGEVVLARRLNSGDVRTQIKKNDILLIWLDDDKFKGYKMRAFESFVGGDFLNTFYYEDGGKIHQSTNPHCIKSVKGVVKYKLDATSTK